MTSTRFCDSAALHALITAHKRAQADGGELRLVIPADGAVPRVLALTGVDRCIACFASMEEAVAEAAYGTTPLHRFVPLPRERGQQVRGEAGAKPDEPAGVVRRRERRDRPVRQPEANLQLGLTVSCTQCYIKSVSLIDQATLRQVPGR
jgi:hypothetical protein